MWVLLQPGDAALVPSPVVPDPHLGAATSPAPTCAQVPLGTGEDFFENVMEAWELGWPKPRVIVLSFPHNPTTATRRPRPTCSGSSTSPASATSSLVHDFAYADLGFDGYAAAVDPAVPRAPRSARSSSTR